MDAVFQNTLIGSALYQGLTLGGILYYTTSGTFVKADYPGLRAVLVECQGGGGAGGGARVTTAGTISAGSGGGGGGYARSLILATDLDETEAVTVGAGGTPVSGGAGGAGGDSVFDTISGEVRGVGGDGGTDGGAAAPTIIVVGSGGGQGTGDLVIRGGAGGQAFYLHLTVSRGGGMGGSSQLGGSQIGPNSNASAGHTGYAYGGGGSGATNGQSQAVTRAGGVGGPGIVIVGLMY